MSTQALRPSRQSRLFKAPCCFPPSPRTYSQATNASSAHYKLWLSRSQSREWWKHGKEAYLTHRYEVDVRIPLPSLLPSRPPTPSLLRRAPPARPRVLTLLALLFFAVGTTPEDLHSSKRVSEGNAVRSFCHQSPLTQRDPARCPLPSPTQSRLHLPERYRGCSDPQHPGGLCDHGNREDLVRSEWQEQDGHQREWSAVGAQAW